MKQIKTNRPSVKTNKSLPTFEQLEEEMLAEKNKHKSAKQKLKDWFGMLK